MKPRFVSLLPVLFIAGALACGAQTVLPLPAPQFPDAMSLAEALHSRRSVREYDATRAVPDQVLSNLLWAACGISSADGKITAPSAMNRQDILVYVCRHDGVWLYQPKDNALRQVSECDVRKSVASRQEFAATAPISLLLASDLTKFPRNAERMGTVDAGYVSQNIYLACTALGLKTVARMTMDEAALREALGLPETTMLLLNHPVGY
ncbi:MAG: SagB/ThcOx family dehydrogenase [Bacteroidaceae bacterium]|nr:SagB/ThcOx family dehydrogenase [Bacteroidaceae bacterium]